jgi:hypothetical protein
MKVKIGLVLSLLLGFAGGAFGASLEQLLNPAQIVALNAGERPTEIQFKDPQFQLIPRHDRLRQVIESVRRELDPGIMVETLFLYKKPAGMETWTAAEQLKLFNGILALSTLTGLQYYSASRQTMRTFYESSQVIDSPSTKRGVSDPVYPFLVDKLTIYARQKDLTFGDNTYQYDYYSFPDALVFVQQNLSSLSVGIIPAVGKNKLRSVVAVIDAGDSLLVYAASMARAASLPGMKERVGNSFSNRAGAILSWFVSQADKVFGAAN